MRAAGDVPEGYDEAPPRALTIPAMAPRYDLLLKDLRICTLAPDAGYGLVEHGAIGIADGRLAWVGPADALPAGAEAAETRALGGALALPGLVDCHTHLVFGGNRA